MRAGRATILERMYDLPPDPERLRVLRIYLQQQLAAVDDKIKQVEASEQSRLARPATAWWMQHLPPASGGRGRGVLHRDGCWAMPKQRMHLHPLSRDEAVLAVKRMSRDEVELCGICHPERDLET
jgi:hypothetical protein